MARPPTRSKTSGTEIDAFLEKVRNTPAPATSGRGKLIFALDATMSREPTWDTACQIQGEMFEATSAIGGLDVQLVFFRGFGECKAGKWQPDAKGLAGQMSKVRCHAGRTQIGKILAHIKRQAEASRIGAAVFVGDAFEEDIDAVCHTAGEIGLLGVPVFLFQEGPDPVAQRAFREIARLTGGAWCPFDLSSAETLKSLLSAVAVYAAGGMKALEDYGRSGRGREAVALIEQMSGRRKGNTSR
ncbi:MAG: VWA domain-containing protein [Alphaproteobacteria bacterium]|nr:VWA domain-containing protein [Alphaproteobacteria bacterium]